MRAARSRFGCFLGGNVGFTACVGDFLMKMLVLQHAWVFLGVKMLVVQHAWLFLEWKYWFYNMFGRVCGEQVCFTSCLCVFVSNVGFTACLGVFGVKMLVSQHVWMFFGCK